MNIPFSRPNLSEDEVKMASKVIKSGWLTTGKVCSEFEDLFSKQFTESVYCVSVNSNTSGLHLCLDSIGLARGDEVIIPSLTFTATAEVVKYFNADIVFCDIDPETLCIDEKKLQQLINSKTKALIPVHFGGHPCKMNSIIKICKENNIKIIEDAAHALPTNYNGKLIGELDSEATVFSFYANKTMTTGEGGMIVTKNKDIYTRTKLMRLHGIDRDSFNRFTSDSYKWYYDVVDAGFKYNLTDIAAAIGIVQLKKLFEMKEKRTAIAVKSIAKKFIMI